MAAGRAERNIARAVDYADELHRRQRRSAIRLQHKAIAHRRRAADMNDSHL